jgi:5-methylcytosine-specific restriction endonuclease McrA
MLQYKRPLVSAFPRQSSDLKSAGFYFGAEMDARTFLQFVRKELTERNSVVFPDTPQERICKECGEWKPSAEFRLYNLMCKKCRSSRVHTWRVKNPEKAKKQSRSYHHNNIEKVRAKDRRYQKTHPEICAARSQNRRAKIKGVGGIVTANEWNNLKEFYNYTCLCCKRKEPEIKLTMDHVLPISSGGKNVIDNIQPLCRSCNCSKHDKYIDYR